jgi:hypothetical protein
MRARRRRLAPLAHFPEILPRDSFAAMKVRTWLPRVLLIVAILGLVARPFTSMVYGSALAAASMLEMPEGMPCCPDDQPQSPDCQKACLLMAACAAKCFSAVPTFASVSFNLRPDGVFRPGRDLIADTMAVEPPARPPRT